MTISDLLEAGCKMVLRKRGIAEMGFEPRAGGCCH